VHALFATIRAEVRVMAAMATPRKRAIEAHDVALARDGLHHPFDVHDRIDRCDRCRSPSLARTA